MTHVPHLITDLALILGVAALTTLLFRWLKQPLVLGYILAGLLVSSNITLFPTVTDTATIRIWADLGVIFLLFSLGLEFSLKKLVQVGGTASLTGLIEISTMLLLGYLTGLLLGWSTMDRFFLGGIVAISSTTIIFRAFDELGLKSRKFVGIVFGILVIEDLVAVVLMVLLSTIAVSRQFFSAEMLMAILKLGFFLIIWFVAGIFLIPSLLKSSRRFMTDETLLIMALALCLLMVVIVTQVGFSPALGAFIMGSILTETIYAERIEHLMKSIKDLFGAIFFVSVGLLIDPAMLVQYAGPIALLTVVVIVGKAVSVTIGALVAGQPLKHALPTGLSLTQIGEFSFIIATLGLTLKVTSSFLYPIAVAVSALTAFTTPYLIRLADPLYRWIDRNMGARTKAFLDQYSSGAQTLGGVSDWKQLIRLHAQAILVNAVLVVGFILIIRSWLLPVLLQEGTYQPWIPLLTALAALTLTGPFLWALLFKPIRPDAYARFWNAKGFYRGSLVALTVARWIVGMGLLFFLLDQLFAIPLLIPTLGLLISVGLLLGKRLSFVYDLIEKRFMGNLHGRQRDQEARMGQNLLPWDAHLTYFEISALSPGVGQTLEELALREQYGINVISIERGNVTKLVPDRTDRLFPGDRIAVTGNDQQLSQFQRVVERNQAEPTAASGQEVSLQKVTVDDSFPFMGQSIRRSGIREQTQGLIVGIERDGQQILNPESTLVFRPGDVIWLAGNTRLIKKLQRQPQA